MPGLWYLTFVLEQQHTLNEIPLLAVEPQEDKDYEETTTEPRLRDQ
ncbi:hypothetical protein KSD_69150 [Ktedonobacter sp. SOSP1-85]|nr:hypothetical protein KSD_69150 [Ktedonobacter sp. SOSP1-85]